MYLLNGDASDYGIKAILFAAIIIGIYRWCLNNRRKEIVCLLIINCFNLYVGLNALNNYYTTNAISNSMKHDIISVATKIEKSADLTEKIYILRGDENNYMGYYYGGVLQTQLPDRKIYYFDSLESINDDGYIITWNTNNNIEILGSTLLYKNNYLSLYDYRLNSDAL